MIWNKKYECMSEDELSALQAERLKAMVSRCYNNVPFYKQKLDELGINQEDINSIEYLKKLPFTLKTDLRDQYPFGLFAVPQKDVVRIHASSGTTGKQTVVGYTRADIETWSEVMARTLFAAGCDENSTLQVGYGYGLFTGGLGAHYGGEKIGASVIPVSGGNTHRQLQILEDFKTTILACTPSYGLYLAEAIEEAGIKGKLKLKSAVFGAEPWTEEMRTELEQRLSIKAFDIYGLSEIIGPGVSFECSCQNGLHVNEDHFIPEIIDPETLEVLPYGSVGELVFTTVTKEALPLIRYRTRDVTRLIKQRCDCGRTTVRMEKPYGRSDDMLIIRGVNVFPSQIEGVLLELSEEASPHYLIVVDRIGNLDTLEVRIELSTSMFSDQVKKIEMLERKITHKIENTLGIKVKVKLVEPKSIPRSEGKAVRVIDNRKLIKSKKC